MDVHVHSIRIATSFFLNPSIECKIRVSLRSSYFVGSWGFPKTTTLKGTKTNSTSAGNVRFLKRNVPLRSRFIYFFRSQTPKATSKPFLSVSKRTLGSKILQKTAKEEKSWKLEPLIQLKSISTQCQSWWLRPERQDPKAKHDSEAFQVRCNQWNHMQPLEAQVQKASVSQLQSTTTSPLDQKHQTS